MTNLNSGLSPLIECPCSGDFFETGIEIIPKKNRILNHSILRQYQQNNNDIDFFSIEKRATNQSERETSLGSILLFRKENSGWVHQNAYDALFTLYK